MAPWPRRSLAILLVARRQHCLGEGLGQSDAAARPDRHADADLAGPLGDRDQPDVHDPDRRPRGKATKGMKSATCSQTSMVGRDTTLMTSA